LIELRFYVPLDTK